MALRMCDPRGSSALSKPPLEGTHHAKETVGCPRDDAARGRLRLGAATAATATAATCRGAAVVHGLLRLGSFEPLAAGPANHRAGRLGVQDAWQRPHYRNRPYR